LINVSLLFLGSEDIATQVQTRGISRGGSENLTDRIVSQRNVGGRRSVDSHTLLHRQGHRERLARGIYTPRVETGEVEAQLRSVNGKTRDRRLASLVRNRHNVRPSGPIGDGAPLTASDFVAELPGIRLRLDCDVIIHGYTMFIDYY